MGRAGNAKHAAQTPPATPAPPVKLQELEYLKLRLLIRDADAVVAAAQAEVNAVIGKRDAYLVELSKKYVIPKAPVQMQWNDDTREFRFSS